MAIKLNRKQLLLIFIVILSAIFCLWKLGVAPIEEWDEATNARVVYELAESNSIADLTLDGENFFEKPMLWYMLSATSIEFFGFSLTTLRLISAFSGFFLIFLIFNIANKKFGFYPAVVSVLTLLGSGQLFLTQNHIFATHHMRSADLDILHILFLMLSFYFLWQKDSKKNRILAGILSGLSVMTKGPFGFLPIIIYFGFKLLKKRKLSTKEFLDIILPCLIIILPWHLYMFISYGNTFLVEYFGYHLIKRTIVPIEGHGDSILFLPKLLFDPRLFFSGLLFLLGLWGIRNKTDNFFYFSIFWGSILILFFLLIIPTKLSWYALYLHPFSTILIAFIWSSSKKKLRTLIVGITILTATILIPVNLYKIAKAKPNRLGDFINSETMLVYEEELNNYEWFLVTRYDLEVKEINKVSENSTQIIVNKRIFENNLETFKDLQIKVSERDYLLLISAPE